MPILFLLLFLQDKSKISAFFGTKVVCSSFSNLAKKANKENFASKVKDWNFCFGQRTFLDLSLISKQNTLIA